MFTRLSLHGDIDVLKNLPLSDTKQSLTGFDQIVSRATALLASQRINE
jgi:hypothetical protein